VKKPGTGPAKSETREEFAARMAKELRNEAQRVLSDAQVQAKQIRKAAAKLDGKRS
jgi:cell division septum initiation protein DivIVA